MSFVDLLTTSTFTIKKELSCGNKQGFSKRSTEHSKATDVLESAIKKGYSTIFERYQDDDTFRERVTEKGLNKNDIRRRDEEAKICRCF